MSLRKLKSKRISLYVLELSGEKYYVGQSRNPIQRINEHFAGDGSSWTRLHKPVGIVKIINTNFSSWRAALEMEALLTLELMKIYGWKNVRGGPYSASDLVCEPIPLSQQRLGVEGVKAVSGPCRSESESQ